MAKTKSGTSISRLFKRYFFENPGLLDENNNQEIYDMFERDHPGIPLTQNIKGICANLKSTLRKKKRQGKLDEERERFLASEKRDEARGRVINRGGRPRKLLSNDGNDLTRVLEELEEKADHWLNEVRAADPHNSAQDIVRLIRRLRNFCSLKLEERGLS